MTEQKRIAELEQKIESLEKTVEELKNQVPNIFESLYQQKMNESSGR